MSGGNIWFYDLNGARNGPVSVQVIRSLARQGIISESTPVSEGTSESWVSFSEVENKIVPSLTKPQPQTESVHSNPQAHAAPLQVPVAGVPQFPPSAHQNQNQNSEGNRTNQISQAGVTGFGEAISVCFHKYFTFSGRANRSEFWYFYLFSTLANIGLVILLGLIANGAPASPFLQALPLVVLVVQLALTIPSLSSGVRRLHDTDKSGWWLLIALIPIIGIIALIVFLAQRGTLQANRFG